MCCRLPWRFVLQCIKPTFVFPLTSKWKHAVVSQFYVWVTEEHSHITSIEHWNIPFCFIISLNTVWDPNSDMYFAHVNSVMLINIWYPVWTSWKTFHKFWWGMHHKYSYAFFFKLSFPTVLDQTSRQTRGGWLDYIMHVVCCLLITYITIGAWKNKTHKVLQGWSTPLNPSTLLG